MKPVYTVSAFRASLEGQGTCLRVAIAVKHGVETLCEIFDSNGVATDCDDGIVAIFRDNEMVVFCRIFEIEFAPIRIAFDDVCAVAASEDIGVCACPAFEGIAA